MVSEKARNSNAIVSDEVWNWVSSLLATREKRGGFVPVQVLRRGSHNLLRDIRGNKGRQQELVALDRPEACAATDSVD